MTAYYVEPDPVAAGGEEYWIEGYAEFDAKLSAAQSDASSATDIGATRVVFSGYLTQGNVITLIGPTRVRQGSIVSNPTSSSFFGGNRIASAALSQNAASATVVNPVRVLFGALMSTASSTALFSGREKWEPDPAVADIWVDDASTSTIWVDDPSASDTWTDD
jgi:hypothetical protein